MVNYRCLTDQKPTETAVVECATDTKICPGQKFYRIGKNGMQYVENPLEARKRAYYKAAGNVAIS